jgi:IS30 family transposase
LTSVPLRLRGARFPVTGRGDLIIGAGHKSALRVIVERKSRFVQIDLLETYKAETVERRFKRLRGGLVKTITFDRGKENSGHKAPAENAGIKAYFCHPRSPWEKGACENTNYLIRDMLNGVADFRSIVWVALGITEYTMFKRFGLGFDSYFKKF